MYRMFAREALDEIEQWRRQATSPEHQLDWRWVKRYRELDAFDAYWWWAQAGPFSDEEKRQWDQLYTPDLDEVTKEQLGALIAQSRQREIMAAVHEGREPRLWYPALDIDEVRRRIAGMLQLDVQISQQEPNAIVRRLYHEAIEEEINFIRMIEATYSGDSESFRKLNQLVDPAPTPEEMEHAFSRLRRVLLQGLLNPETVEVSQRVITFLREQLHLSLDLSYGEQEAQQIRHTGPVSPARPQRTITSQAAKRFFETILCESGYTQWKVIIDPKTSGPRVDSGLRHLYLPDDQIALERIRHYLAHELAGHVARSIAGERSLLGLLGIGTKGYLPTEEGFAYLQERQAMAVYSQTFDDTGTWLGTLATGLASGVVAPAQTFLPLFTFFESLHLLLRLLERLDRDVQTAQQKARTTALSRCLRTYRGVPDLERAGVCFCKDAVYLRGFRLIERLAAQDEMILDRLAVGKVAVEYLPEMQELGLAPPAQPLRKLVYDPNLESYILSFESAEEHSHRDA
jgi:hypothetical protein